LALLTILRFLRSGLSFPVRRPIYAFSHRSRYAERAPSGSDGPGPDRGAIALVIAVKGLREGRLAASVRSVTLSSLTIKIYELASAPPAQPAPG
jgi:hypothetical protein